jgi:hypothetical protein
MDRRGFLGLLGIGTGMGLLRPSPAPSKADIPKTVRAVIADEKGPVASTWASTAVDSPSLEIKWNAAGTFRAR